MKNEGMSNTERDYVQDSKANLIFLNQQIFSGYDGYVSFQGINEVNRSPVGLNFQDFG